ncbi:hypothetical protein GJR98_01920 [Haloferax sp. MBLA0077]|uniref:Small CPxCG-related zinc finger protein n=1 Tax=Haloferax marinisediminis TaxID=2666142 RepID=A0A6G1YYJ9_9EURY|nr:hypothetical protein [Haloferax marinisediminis]
MTNQCNHCEAFVSRNFIRVFGDDQGNVYACPSCSANAGISQVSAERRAAES